METDYRLSNLTITRYSVLVSAVIAALMSLALVITALALLRNSTLFIPVVAVILIVGFAMFTGMVFVGRIRLCRLVLRIGDAIRITRPSGIERTYSFASVRGLHVYLFTDGTPMRIDVSIENDRSRLSLSGYEDMPRLLIAMKERIPANCQVYESYRANPYYAETRALTIFAVIVVLPLACFLLLMNFFPIGESHEESIAVLTTILGLAIGVVLYVRRRHIRRN
ncbi:MAG: hypothetical protein AMXMBFR84_38200 [Candidatus Hydrogenedentota bacterium]